jgi:mRNA interferase MazF
MQTSQKPNYQPGDVVIVAAVPYPDGSGAKIRPSVVVSTPEFSSGCDSNLIILRITSSPRATCDTDVPIVEWREAGLDKPSIVRCFPATVGTSLIVRKIGTLTPQDWQEVCEAMRRAIACFTGTIPPP